MTVNVQVDSRRSPAQLLEALKTVDGPGSGLDADLLDGLSSGDLSGAGSSTARQETLPVAAGQPAALAFTPIANAEVGLYVNGDLQEQGTGKDYTISGKIPTWISGDFSLTASDIVIVRYRSA